jgi:hypothetical protein
VPGRANKVPGRANAQPKAGAIPLCDPRGNA